MAKRCPRTANIHEMIALRIEKLTYHKTSVEVNNTYYHIEIIEAKGSKYLQLSTSNRYSKRVERVECSKHTDYSIKDLILLLIGRPDQSPLKVNHFGLSYLIRGVQIATRNLELFANIGENDLRDVMTASSFPLKSITVPAPFLDHSLVHTSELLVIPDEPFSRAYYTTKHPNVRFTQSLCCTDEVIKVVERKLLRIAQENQNLYTFALNDGVNFRKICKILKKRRERRTQSPNEVILHVKKHTEMRVWFEVDEQRYKTMMVEFRAKPLLPDYPVLN